MSDKIRPSKAIMTHGPGAIIDLQEGKSGLVMSPDYWNKYTIIKDRRLAKYLGVKNFRSPSQGTFRTEEDRWLKTGVIYTDFPKRWYCPQCRYLKPASYGICKSCSDKLEKPVNLVVPRLVAACQGGHIQDFPWKSWIKCKCSRSEIKLTGSTDSSSDMLIKCTSCNNERDLRGALGTLKQFNCNGHRPWIGESADEKCERKLHGLMKGASNTYFPRTISSILIPPYSSRIQQEIMTTSDIETVRNNYLDVTQDWNDSYWDRFIERKFGAYIQDNQYTSADFKRAFANFVDDNIEESLKDREWETLLDPSDRDEEFLAEVNRGLEHHTLKTFFDKVILVRKLTEVIALRNFTRIYPPTSELPLSKEDYTKFASASIREEDENKWHEIKLKMNKKWDIPEPKRTSRGVERRKDWLPAVKNRGEGIFIVFNKDKLTSWENNNQWKKRVKGLSENANYISQLDGFQDDSPKSLLIHTFSHLLAIEIAKECGYQLASIRERLYCAKNMYGVLLYTSTPDSQGSLGGLISQARDLNILENHIERVKEAARICSQDPLCGEHEPKNTEKPWGASCHSCTNMPETSCESLMNQFLDRRTIIGEDNLPGYFD